MASFNFLIAFFFLAFQGPFLFHKQGFVLASDPFVGDGKDSGDIKPDNETEPGPDVSGDLGTCDELKVAYKQGFLTRRQRGEYCLLKCSFLSISCEVIEETTTESVFFRDLYNWTERLIDGETILDDDVELSPEIYEICNDLWRRHWVVLLAFIPILLNQLKYYNWPFAVFWSLVFIFVHLLGIGTSMGAVHNIVIAALCVFFPANSSGLGEAILATIFVNGILCFAFVQDYTVQVFFLLVGLAGYFAYLHWTFFIKRNSSGAGIMVIMAQIGVLHEQLIYMREQYMLNSLIDVGMQSIFNAVMPGGKYIFFGKNAASIACKLVKFLDVPSHRFSQFLIFFVVQIVMFLAFRGCLGAFYIYSLRYRSDYKSLWYGLIVYMVDFFGPLQTFWYIGLRYEEPNIRRTLYAACGTLMLAFEFNSATGVFWIRLFATIVDKCFVRSTYGRQTHYLMMNMNFMSASFPQDNAAPWTSLQAVTGIAEHTDRVVVKRKGGSVRGMGTIVRNGGNRRFYSVNHVVEGAESVTFKGEDIPLKFKPVNDNHDPMVVVVLEDGAAVDVDLLCADEASDVEQIMFVNAIVDGTGEVVDKAICVVDGFKFVDNCLRATVNLMKGDSGGPAFAVLSNGEIRLCGVVSRGDMDRANGNIMSVPFLGVTVASRRPIANFNRARQFVGGKTCPFTSVNECLMEYREVLSEVAALAIKFDDKGFVDMEKLEATLSEASELGKDTERNDDDGDDHIDRNHDRGDDIEDGYGHGPRKRHARQDFRRRNKDKAARKRDHFNAEVLEEVLVRLRRAYSRPEANEIFAAILAGITIPKLQGSERFAVTRNGKIVIVKED